jgi:long-chain acyl-CoA synthetase
LKAVSQEEGWFATGDLGELDASGNLYFKGRKKNVMVTPEGMNIYPGDLEAALRREPEVRDAVVVSLTSEGREEPCAVVLLRENAAGDAEARAADAVECANRSLAEYQRMRRWLAWPGEDFPRTSTGKPRVGEIRERAEAALTGSPVRAIPSAIAKETTLAGLIARITGRTPPAIASDARLESDLNLTSLERVELLGAIEDRYQVELNESSFTAAATVGEIEKMLHESRPQRSAYRFPRWASRAPVAWLRAAVYYLLTWPATVLLACPRVRGRENLREVRGPVLVVCNHVTPIDIGWVLKALPPRFRHHLATAMAGERLMAMRHPPGDAGWLRRLFDPVRYFLVVALFNVFPLPKLTGFRESFEFAGESIERGESVLIFPEGELTKDGNVAPFRAGIGVLAAKLGVPIIPMRLDGLFDLRQAGKRIARPFQVKVTIGSPVRFPPGTDPAAITRELLERMESLGGRR